MPDSTQQTSGHVMTTGVLSVQPVAYTLQWLAEGWIWQMMLPPLSHDYAIALATVLASLIGVACHIKSRRNASLV